MIKITCVHTAASPTMIQFIEDEMASAIQAKYCVSHITLPDVIADVIDADHITPYAAAALLDAYSFCYSTRTNIVLHMCSSVGVMADQAREAYLHTGMRIIRIDEEMCREAAKNHTRIGVVGTLPTTLSPSTALISRLAREAGVDINIVPILAEGGFNKSSDEMKRLLCDSISKHLANIDAIVLAQASMAPARDVVANETRLPVYSSPQYAAKALARAVRDLQS